MRKFLSILLCLIMTVTACSNFCFAQSAQADVTSLDYDALFEKAFVINGAWESADLQSGKDVSFYFRGKYVTEHYQSARHFNSFDVAYEYYISQNPDILEDLPVFIFAPGTYDSIITVRFSAIILGANAGINPNADIEWTLDAMEGGVAVSPERTQETVFTAGLTRTTRTPDSNAKWAYLLEKTEAEAGKKADIRFIVDGVKITGSVGIAQYDYSNRLYTDLNLDGEAFEFTPEGNRTTLTALVNSIVDEFSGTGPNALFSARCNSMNKNDAVMKNVRITNVAKSAKFLFNKFFRNLTVDGMYFADSDISMFGTAELGSTFFGDSQAKTVEYDQNVEIKNSVFYKNNAPHTIALGSESVGSGHKKLTANIHHNFFYDSVCFDTEKDCWGIFLLSSPNTSVEYTMNVTDNIIHQQTSYLESLVHGTLDFQKSKMTFNFNRNKVTGRIRTIYPNTNWNSNYYNYINTSVFYDFSDNFHATSPDEIASRPVWAYPPKTNLASGYDYKTAPYYLDYDLTISSKDYEIETVEGLGDNYTVSGYNVTADCSSMSGTSDIIITTKSGKQVGIYKDVDCTVPVTSIDFDSAEKGESYFLETHEDKAVIRGLLNVYTGKYTDIASANAIDAEKFSLPVITVNTDGGAPIVDKENYVDCLVSIGNTDDEYCLDEKVAGIRYRGNSTLVASDKKPYRIKFDKKQDLFGMGKAKSWVLLANSFDKTMVRNSIAFAIGSQLGLDYTSEFQFVNLYLNGDYKGVYLLCEQTQAGSTRVDIEEDETGKVDTGYLIEMAGNGEPDEDRQFRINPVPKEEFADGVTANWRENTIYGYLKTPEYEFCTDEQVEFISGYVNDVNHAILTQDFEKFDELCDVESFAKYFVTSTILNNGDGGYQVYTYKKENGGKLYAGPLWDFDQSSAATVQCGDTYDKWYTGSKFPWFDSFSNWPEFMRIAKSIYLKNYDEIQEIIDYYTTEFYPANAYDFHANDLRWNSVGGDYWRITDTVKTLKSYNANYAHLSLWFDNRTAWLDNEYAKALSDGWYFEDGWFFYENGFKVKNNWMLDSYGWCFLGSDGKMVTNSWIMDSQGWCYVGADGYCVTNQWMADSIGWCYLNAEGRMATNQWIMDSQGWCYVGSDGYCVTNQWMADSIGWCYLNSEGRMATNQWIMDSQGWCYVGSDGYCLTNCWKADSIGWCYLDSSGRMVTKTWIADSQGLCWLDENGYWNGIYN